CGACGQACSGVDSRCCGGQCVAPWDLNNCGACGNVCTGEACCVPVVNGVVVGVCCAPGEVCCSEICVKLQADAHNCGICGKVCSEGGCKNGNCCYPAGAQCVDGAACCSGTSRARLPFLNISLCD